MRLYLSKSKLFLWGLVALLFLNLGNAAAQYLLQFHTHSLAGPVEALFGFDRESNPVAVFNAMLLFAASCLAFAIGQWRRTRPLPWGPAWIGLALVLAFLFLDELVGLHDSLDFFLMKRCHTSGSFAWPWVIVYGFLSLLVSAIYLRFFLALPNRYKWRFALAAVTYVGGALGLEMIAASHVEDRGEQDFLYAVLFTIEENLEMVGCLFAIHGLLDYLERECPGFELTIRSVR